MMKFNESDEYENDRHNLKIQQETHRANFTKFQKILIYIVLILVITIIFITAGYFASGKAHPVTSVRRADPAPQKIIQSSRHSDTKLAAFTGIGRIRSLTATETNTQVLKTSVIVTPWLAYPDGDTVFLEELSQKQNFIKSLIATYFSKYTENQLRSMGEQQIKAELLKEINEHMVLGQVSAIYFSEYIFLG